MAEENVAIRLKLFIESLGVSYAQFADECGIPRPSLSQLITGRNKKISDIIIRQIHQAFPGLNVMWLLFGEGGMTSSPASPQGAPAVSEDVPMVRDYEDTPPYGYSSPSPAPQDDIFSSGSVFSASPSRDTIKFSSDDSQSGIRGKETALSPGVNVFNVSDSEIGRLKKRVSDLSLQIEKLRRSARKVVQITVYYDDSTFETFIPEK